MSVLVVTAFPEPGHRAEVVAAFETALDRKLSRRLDVQRLEPHPIGDPGKAAL